MSQQMINISTPDDGLGDVLRNGFDKANQNFTELYNGKVDKVTGKGLSENDFTDADKAKLDGIEAGAQVNINADFAETDPLAPGYILNVPPSLYSAFGYFHYADLDTQTTPLAFVSSTPLQLINDTLGAFTNENQAPYGISGVWDKPTDSLDFSQLSVGDAVLFRADLSISTTSINQNLQLYIKFGIGTPSEYDLLIDSWNEKSVITFKHFLKDVSFSIDNEDWRDAPAKIYILSDYDGEVKVNGWYTPIIRKSVNIIDFNSDPLKLDKVSTAGVERTYIVNADGSQGTKPTSEFGGVLEFANLAAFPVTGETGKIYIALDNGLTYRWSGSAYVQIGGGTNKQIFQWWGGNWTTTTLGNYYYIGYNGAAIEGLNNTISAAMNGRNKGLFITPFNCKIKRVMFKEGGSGSYTGNFVLASGLPIYGDTWNTGYANTVTHLNQAITSAGYQQKKFEFLVTDNITVPKGYAVCPMLVFSAQAQAGKTGVEISIEIEEVV